MRVHIGNRDENEAGIVDALKEMGASVERLNIKDGADLLVGYGGADYLLEVKHPDREKDHKARLERQERWRQNWRGRQPTKVLTVDEAFRAVGIVVRKARR